MSDRFWGKIEFGGTLPKAKLPDLDKTLVYEGLKSHNSTIEDWLNEHAINQDKPCAAEAEDSEATYGHFETLETFCRNNNLTYVVESAAFGEYDAETVWYADGMEGRLLNNVNGSPTVRAYDIQELMKQVDSAIKKVTPRNAPLHINNKNAVKQAYAKYLLGCKKPSPYEFFKRYFTAEYLPEPPEVPALVIS